MENYKIYSFVGDFYMLLMSMRVTHEGMCFCNEIGMIIFH